jgi:hypothetical protein
MYIIEFYYVKCGIFYKFHYHPKVYIIYQYNYDLEAVHMSLTLTQRPWLYPLARSQVENL